jgi:hypothetical protein
LRIITTNVCDSRIETRSKRFMGSKKGLSVYVILSQTFCHDMASFKATIPPRPFVWTTPATCVLAKLSKLPVAAELFRAPPHPGA